MNPFTDESRDACLSLDIDLTSGDPLRALVVAVERLNQEAPLCPIPCDCATCAVLTALLYLPPAWRKAA